MGYRNYLGKFSKAKYENYKDLSEEELINKLNTTFISRIPGYKEVCELGKYNDFDPSLLKPFFSFKLEDEECYIASKEFLKSIIEYYSNEVYKSYEKTYELYVKLSNNEILDPQDIGDLLLAGRSKCFEWKSANHRPYYLDETNKYVQDKIVRSWKYEYAVFELARIYKTFNWEKDLLIYSGH